MNVKVLGPGCKRCQATQQIIEKVAQEEGIQIELEKIEDMEEMMKYNIMSTPAVIINNVLKISGRVSSRDEVRELLHKG